MNGIDIVALCMMGAGYVRGRKRGLGLELYRLVRIAIPVVAGCGLYGLFSKALSMLPGLDPENSGFVGFLGVTLIAFALMRKTMGRLRTMLEARFGSDTHRGRAGAVGLVRYAVIAVALVTGIELSPAEFMTEDSALGRVVGVFVDR